MISRVVACHACVETKTNMVFKQQIKKKEQGLVFLKKEEIFQIILSGISRVPSSSVSELSSAYANKDM